jgi:DNA primase
VASSGTALTEQQLRIIRRYTDNLAMAFDTDLAGESATKRSSHLATQIGFNVKVISLPDNQDPADYLQKDISGWSRAIKQAQGLIEFYLAHALAKYNPSAVEGKKQISQIVLPVIKKIPNKVEQGHWVQELARQLKVQETALAEEMRKIKDSFDSTGSTGTVPAPKGAGTVPVCLEEYALGLVLANSENLKQCQNEPGYLFTNSELKEIFEHLKKNKSLKKFKKRVDDLVFKSEIQKGLVDEFQTDKEIKFCFSQLKDRYLRQKRNKLTLAIQEAENKNDEMSRRKLTEEFNKLLK